MTMLRTCCIVLLLAVAGCATSPEPVVVSAPEPETAPPAPEPVAATNVLAGAADGDTAELQFKPQRSADGEFAIGIIYIGYAPDAWCYIPPGASLSLVIDGNRHYLMTHRGSEGGRKALDNNRVGEVAVYPTPPDIFTTLINAQQVEVILEGSRLTVQRHFAPGNYEALRQFMTQQGL